MIISFKPDWTKIWTPAESEVQLFGFKFKGPGWYTTSTETMLVIPLRDRKTTWEQRYDPGELFEFNVYNDRNPTTAFNEIINAPTRLVPE